MYARWLSQRGYKVHLLDAMPEHIERAREAGGVASAEVGDARHLSYSAESTDAVLLMGPLYHLTEHDDRLDALREAHRVLRLGGTLVAVGIPHTAAIMGDLTRNLTDEGYGRLPREEAFRSGQYRNPEGRPGYFTTAFFHRPAELEAEVRAAGFASKGVYAVEGPTTLLSKLAEVWQNEKRREGLMATLRLLERESTLLGVSPHLAVPALKIDKYNAWPRNTHVGSVKAPATPKTPPSRLTARTRATAPAKRLAPPPPPQRAG